MPGSYYVRANQPDCLVHWAREAHIITINNDSGHPEITVYIFRIILYSKLDACVLKNAGRVSGISIMSGSLNHHQHLERPQSRGLLFPLGRLTCVASVPTLKEEKSHSSMHTARCLQTMFKISHTLGTRRPADEFSLPARRVHLRRKLNHRLWLCTSLNTTRVICGLVRAEVRINDGISG